jgi:hypothetical protein
MAAMLADRSGAPLPSATKVTAQAKAVGTHKKKECAAVDEAPALCTTMRPLKMLV